MEDTRPLLRYTTLAHSMQCLFSALVFVWPSCWVSVKRWAAPDRCLNERKSNEPIDAKRTPLAMQYTDVHLGHASQAAKPVVTEEAKPTRISPTTATLNQSSNSNVKPKPGTAAGAPRKADARPPERPVPRQKRPSEKRAQENPSFGGNVPAYMKATASVKAKDARDQQAKIAAARSALTEKKWNRA